MQLVRHWSRDEHLFQKAEPPVLVIHISDCPSRPNGVFRHILREFLGTTSYDIERYTMAGTLPDLNLLLTRVCQLCSALFTERTMQAWSRGATIVVSILALPYKPLRTVSPVYAHLSLHPASL